GCSLRTLHRRLAEGRERLRLRLTRRGVTLSSALLLLALQHDVTAAAPPALFAATLREAAAFVAGAGLPSSRAAIVADRFLKGMLMTKLQIVAILLMALLSLTAGALWREHGARADSIVVPEIEAAATAEPVGESEKPSTNVDAFAQQVWSIMDT